MSRRFSRTWAGAPAVASAHSSSRWASKVLTRRTFDQSNRIPTSAPASDTRPSMASSVAPLPNLARR